MSLSNTTTQVLASSPYFNDYDTEKGFHQILFRPRVPVQTRELNQLQSIAQNQIEQLGSGIFKEGAAVTGGNLTFSNNVVSLQVVRKDSVDIANFFNTTTTTGRLARGATSLAEGQVVQVSPQNGQTYAAVLVSMLTADTFVGGESVSFVGTDGTADMILAPSPVHTVPACVFSVDDGVFFLRGHLVDVNRQTVVLSTNSASASARVGFVLDESIITPEEDTSLNDPALGTTNYAAPGAHRLKLSATLVARPVTGGPGSTVIDHNADADFIEVARVINGVLQQTTDRLAPTLIEETLARRTYDESGDYVVTPFRLTVKDHNPSTAVPNVTGQIDVSASGNVVTGTGTLFASEMEIGDRIVVNGEQRTITLITNNTTLQTNSAFSVGATATPFTVISDDRLNLELESGKAYVRGLEFQTLGTTKLEVLRPRTVARHNNYTIGQFYGPFLYVNQNAKLFDIDTLEKVDLHSVDFAGINATSATLYSASQIGTARVRAMNYASGLGDANTVYKMYLVAAEFQTKNFTVTTGTNDTQLTNITIDANAGTVALRQNSASTNVSILPTAANAYQGATLILTDIDGGRVSYGVLSSTATVTNSTVRTVTSTVDTKAFLNRINATGAVTVVFSDKCIRGITESSTKAKGASTHLLSRAGIDRSGNTIMYGTNSTSLLFPYPQSWISTSANSIVDQTFEGIRKFSVSPTTNATHTTVVMSVSDGSKFAPVQFAYTNFAVSNNTTFVSLVGASATLTVSDTTATLVIPGASFGTPLTVYAKLDGIGGDLVKTLYLGNTSSASVNTSGGILNSAVTDDANNRGHIAINTVNVSSSRTITLGVPDVTEVLKVWAVPTVANANSWVDVTANYTLDTGQRPWCYDHAALVLKPGSTHYPTANAMLVVVNRFGHSIQGGGSLNASPYFTPKSYVGIDIGDIPHFVDPDSGTTIPLRSVVDFRPVRTANVAAANTASTSNPYVNSTATFAARTLPDPEGVYTADFDYYLPRVDKVVLTKERQLQVLQGEPALRPVAPADASDGMTLYIVTYPPYTADVNAVQVQPIDHRRYTMRDIGRLEKRIDNLEYYVSLSMLEQVTAQQPEYDDNDIERFKNGILVDPFSSHAIGAVDDVDYACAIDEVRRELRPGFSSNAYNFGGYLSDTSTGVTLTGNTMVTLSYSVTPVITQPLASKSVNINPFNVSTWNGQMQLTPSSDIWMDTTTLPTVSRNLAGEQDNWEEIGFGTVWGDWRTMWVGQPTVTQESVAVVGMQLGSDLMRGELRNQWVDVIQTTESTTRGMERTGSNITAKASTISTDLGERIVDISVVPFMRAKDVVVVGTGMLPGATLLATFDGVDVTNFVDKANELTVASNAIAATYQVGERITSGTGPTTGTGMVAAISANVLRLVDCQGNFAAGATVNGVSSGASTTVSTYTSHSGVVVGPGSGSSITSVELDYGAGAAGIPVDGYVGKTLFLTAGPGAGQRTVITAYNSGTRTATVSPALTATSGLVGAKYSIGQLQADNLSTVVTDPTRVPGTFTGLFRLPAGRFNTGRRVFRLSDSSAAASAKTFAEGVYEASGQTKTVERTVVSTRNITFDKKQVSEVSSVTTTSSPSLSLVASGVYIDPLAQTFLVDARKYPSGIFIHSVDLFFAKVDPSGLPVIVQIRPTVNGYPSADAVVPFAEAVVSPNRLQTTPGTPVSQPSINQVPANVTPNPDVSGHATRFTFPSLVYLAPGTEYAIVVLTNSFNYEVFVGEVRKQVINSDLIISDQPYAGSFFKSQNARTWTAEQYEDLMFVLNRAEFGTTGTAMFGLGSVPAANTLVDMVHIETGHVDFDATSPTTRHQFGIRNAVSSTVLPIAVRTGEDIDMSIGGFGERKLLVSGSANSALLQATLGTTDTAVSPIYDMERMSLIVSQNKIDDGGLYSNGFVIKNPGVVNPIGTTSFSLTITGGNGSGAVATATCNATSGQVESITVSSAGTGYTQTPTVGWSQAFTTNAVIEYRGETSAKCDIVGEQKARYITRRVTLADGFDASDLKVYFSANRPSGTNIDVYYKALATGDPQNFDDKSWTRMLPRVGQEQMFANHAQHFREYEFKTATNTASYTSGGNTYDRFHTFAIKIVLRSTDPTVVPRLRNLRVIALDE